jgi:Asp/Glu/hydantoin racemase
VTLPVFGIREQAFHEAERDGRPLGIATTTPQLTDPFRVIVEKTAMPRSTAASASRPAIRRS